MDSYMDASRWQGSLDVMTDRLGCRSISGLLMQAAACGPSHVGRPCATFQRAILSKLLDIAWSSPTRRSAPRTLARTPGCRKCPTRQSVVSRRRTGVGTVTPPGAQPLCLRPRLSGCAGGEDYHDGSCIGLAVRRA